jgi:hypothetical protein
MNEGDVILTPLPQADGQIKNRRALARTTRTIVISPVIKTSEVFGNLGGLVLVWHQRLAVACKNAWGESKTSGSSSG